MNNFKLSNSRSSLTMPEDTDMMPTMECTASPEHRMSLRVVRMGSEAPIVTSDIYMRLLDLLERI